MARGLAEMYKDQERLSVAWSFCFALLNTYWNLTASRLGPSAPIRPVPVTLPPLERSAQTLAQQMGEHLAERHDPLESGYLVGTVYTAMLPEAQRSSLGAYYTPPSLVNRLLDLTEQTGFDWTRGTIIDPACGGGAFLAPVAARMLQHIAGEPREKLTIIAERLAGQEIDPFAGWMSQVMLDIVLLPLCTQAGCRPPNLVKTVDSLTALPKRRYDLVIGNPPYGRVRLDGAMRKAYARSLYGHANLYGLFTDLALRLTTKEGMVAYVTPTSFLGGQYFKALRALLFREARPAVIDFVADREGVFDDVLQETALSVFVRSKQSAEVEVSEITPRSIQTAHVQPVGRFTIEGEAPWILPRHPEQAAFFRHLKAMPTRLSHLGYNVSTGPLVWNRHKDQLLQNRLDDAYPIVWSEAVTDAGFSFSATKRNHVPFIRVEPGQTFLKVQRECVLVHRTTAKEQNRRLLAAVMPQSFIDAYGAAVVENHLNMIYPDRDVEITPATLSALLNCKAVDMAFRCISGSVAVSAYELHALPLPGLPQLLTLQQRIGEGAAKQDIEQWVNQCYGVTNHEDAAGVAAPIPIWRFCVRPRAATSWSAGHYPRRIGATHRQPLGQFRRRRRHQRLDRLAARYSGEPKKQKMRVTTIA
ncbi:N-6 DNA methylase [Heliobacterium undosum]|uniref:site-specific DNA-methyltransferase (adenine-specific) n=2 Tax=Heliomicrobium undosum TaxID=121734 RepID=A0A845L245_9FIRM|nr:N-6 DNA methylase [Heliomicrobium undosum]